jgi:hypothetical protein
MAPTTKSNHSYIREMNLTKLGFSSWIIFLNITLLLVLLIQLYKQPRESYVNYPQQVNPSAPVKSDPDAAAANNNYASILMFLQKNPAKSVKFISDIKQKFFTDGCTVKDNIDFNNIAQLPDGMPF